ncbi:MAG: CvpA family protein [Methylovulum sp.]|nr:CvpA family protein [Methylovulum sp.]
MIWVDFAIIGMQCMTLTAGLIKGVSQQAYSLMWWLLAVAVGLNFSPEFAMFLKASINDPAARMAAAFVALCLITLMVGGLIRVLLGGLIKKSGLTLVERLAGLVFGAAHGVIWVAVLVMLAGLSVLPQSPWWKKSKLIPPFQSIVVGLHNRLPSELTKNVNFR